MRGAAIETSVDVFAIRSLDECDAVVLMGDGACSADAIQSLRNSRKPVLRLVGRKVSQGELKTWLSEDHAIDSIMTWVNPDRFLPSRQLIRQQLESKKLGEPGLMRIHRWRPSDAKSDSDSANELPTAMLCDFDTALWLMSRSPNLVYAIESPPKESESHAGRFIQVHLGFDGGGMALIDFCDQMPNGDHYDSLSVIGSTGAAYADDQQNRQLLFRGGTAQAIRTNEGVRQQVAMMQEFVDAIVANRDLSGSISSWKTVLSVADAVCQSLATRQAVRWEGC